MTADHLVSGLRQSLQHLERVAQTATPGPWSSDPTGTVCADSDLRPDGQGGEILPPDGPMEVAECYRNERSGERGHNAEHIAAWDPSSVLGLIGAARKIIDHYEAQRDQSSDGPPARVLRRCVLTLAEGFGLKDGANEPTGE